MLHASVHLQRLAAYRPVAGCAPRAHLGASSVCGRRPASAHPGTRTCLPVPQAAATSVDTTSHVTVVPADGIHAPVEQEQAAGQRPLDWTDAWYPICFEPDMDKSAPYPFTLLNIPLVLWWDPNGKAWRAHQDLCPHRLVPLSEGRINTKGNLECGYHGWEFSATGRCEKIPQGGNPGTARACITAYPCTTRQGMVWVRPQALPNPITSTNYEQEKAKLLDESTLPIIPELESPDWVPQDTWRDLPYSYETLLENVLDVSHVPFTHHKSMSNRNQIGDFKLHMDGQATQTGFSGGWKTGPRAGGLGPQTTHFTAPGYMKHTLDAGEKRGFQALTVVYAVPQSPGKCRLINRNCTRFLKTGLPSKIMRMIPAWAGHVSSHTLLEDDQIFLHVGEPLYVEKRAQGATNAGTYYLASPADLYISAFRSWLDKFAGGGPFGPATQEILQQLGPRATRDQLLDRYSQHTERCATCQKGLKQIRSYQEAARLVSSVAVGLAIYTCAVAVAVASMGGTGLGVAAAGVAEATGGSPTLAAAGSALLWVAQLLAGTGTPALMVLRAVAFLAVAGVAQYFRAQLTAFEGKFIKGTWPPPRNLAKDP